MRLPLQSIPSSLFNFVEANRFFVADASNFRESEKSLYQQIYDDSCDVGFAMASTKTSQTVTYVHSHIEIRDGETLWDDYTPLPEDIRKIPAAVGTKVRIFNT